MPQHMPTITRMNSPCVSAIRTGEVCFFLDKQNIQANFMYSRSNDNYTQISRLSISKMTMKPR